MTAGEKKTIGYRVRSNALAMVPLCALTLASCGRNDDKGSAGGGSPPGQLGDGMLMRMPLSAGQAVDIPFRIARTPMVAAQFDLTYDPEALQLDRAIDTAIENSTKRLTVAHVRGGVARVVVFGFDLEPLPEGLVGTARLVARKDTPMTEVLATKVIVAHRTGLTMKSGFRAGQLIVGEEVIRGN